MNFETRYVGLPRRRHSRRALLRCWAGRPALRSGLYTRVTPPAPRPAAAPTQALYESQIRELTHEIRAWETELDQLVEALDATARERDAAMRVVRQL
ncbi:MAG: hypothetical protein GXX91_09130, partial [Verrucomicrobiaceae bacterium]|nr:hypothetical protein [Verrucomicrobiaceae bacterium]